MDPYDSLLRSPYSSPNNPFPHSLLRARESSQAKAKGCSASRKLSLRFDLGLATLNHATLNPASLKP